jgi:lambda family phage tail tape measure protein
MEKATGQSIDATIAEFVKIADDPVAAAKSLNDQYHFLTASTYAQIVALKEQGDTIGATKLLTDTYADTVKDRAGQITQNLGLIERGWKGIKDAASGALDATLNIGRQATLEQQIQSVKTRLTDPESYSNGPDLANYDGQNSSKTGSTQKQDQAQLEFLLRQKNTVDAIALAQGLYGEQQKASIDSQDKLNASLKTTASNQDKLKARLEEINELAKKSAAGDGGTVYTDAQLNQLRDAAKKEFADKTKAGSVDLTAFNDAQRALKDLQDTYSNTVKQLDASQKAGLITQQAYVTQKAVLINAEKEQVTSAYGAEISVLEAVRAKSSTTEAQRSQLDQKIADTRMNMVKAQKDADTQLEVIATNETGRLKKQTEAVNVYTEALQQQVETLRNQGIRAANGLGQGDRERTLADQQNGIDDRFNQQKLALANQYGDGSRGMSLDEYNDKLKALKVTQQDLHDTVRSNYDEMTKAQGDWSAGASSAWQNYLNSARDVAGQTKSLFTNAFSSMDSAIANFAVTGKLSFSDFTKSIIADLSRIASRQASSAILSSLFGVGVKALSGGSASAGSSQAGYGGDLSSFTPVANAKGGVYDGPGISAYSSSVVSSPTMFAFANGTGLMGEAGPEAIMPLTRGANGKLGVQSIGGGGSSGGAPIVYIAIASNGQADVSSNQSGLESFGAEVGKFVESKYKELEAKSLGSQGNIRNAINGRG